MDPAPRNVASMPEGPEGPAGPGAPQGPSNRSPGLASRLDEPAIDEVALVAARRAEIALEAARERGQERWAMFLAPLPERLRDEPVAALRPAVLRARAAFGPKDSIRDVLPSEVTEPLLDSLDRLTRELNRRDARSR